MTFTCKDQQPYLRPVQSPASLLIYACLPSTQLLSPTTERWCRPAHFTPRPRISRPGPLYIQKTTAIIQHRHFLLEPGFPEAAGVAIRDDGERGAQARAQRVRMRPVRTRSWPGPRARGEEKEFPTGRREANKDGLDEETDEAEGVTGGDEAQQREAAAERDDRTSEEGGEDEERPGDRRERHDDRGDADASEERHGGKPAVGRPNGPRGAGCVGAGGL